MFRARRLVAGMVLPRFILLLSLQACILLLLASAQLLHGMGSPTPHSAKCFLYSMALLTQGCMCQSRNERSYYIPCKQGIYLCWGFRWDRAMLKGSCQHNRTEWNCVVSIPRGWELVCSEQLKQLRNHAVSAFQKKALCTQSQQRGSPWRWYGPSQFCHCLGTSCCTGSLSVPARLSLGWSLFKASEAPEDWKAGKQGSGVTLWPLAYKSGTSYSTEVSSSESQCVAAKFPWHPWVTCDLQAIQTVWRVTFFLA